MSKRCRRYSKRAYEYEKIEVAKCMLNDSELSAEK